LQEREPVLRRYPPVLRPHLTVPLLPPHGGDGDVHEVRPTSSSTRSPLHGLQPLSHRWPPALRGSLPPGPALPTLLISGLPHPRAPQPDQPGSPH
jgi:hypothetical protein